MSPTKLHSTKVVTRVISLVFAIITAPLLGRAAILQDNTFYTDGTGELINAIALTSPLASFIWSLTSLVLIVMLSRKRKPYYPAVDIALDFVMFGVAMGFAGVVISWNVYLGGTSGYEYRWNMRHLNPDPSRARAAAREMNGIENSAGAFLVLLGVTHLVLCVVGCYETRQWKLAKDCKSDKSDKVDKADIELDQQVPVKE